MSHAKTGRTTTEVLLAMEEPLRDTVLLTRAASMACSDISNPGQRDAMMCVLFKALAAAVEAQDGWREAHECAVREKS